jgi:hypothetical protein
VQVGQGFVGTNQDPRAWYSSFSMKIQPLGFVPSKADASLFFNKVM